MITSLFVYDKKMLKSIKVSGHANYKKKGEDIVCAAVSTATLMTYNAIEHLKLDHLVECQVSDGYFYLRAIDDHLTILALLENLVYTLNELEKQYPKYMKNQEGGITC